MTNKYLYKLEIQLFIFRLIHTTTLDDYLREFEQTPVQYFPFRTSTRISLVLL